MPQSTACKCYGMLGATGGTVRFFCNHHLNIISHHLGVIYLLCNALQGWGAPLSINDPSIGNWQMM